MLWSSGVVCSKRQSCVMRFWVWYAMRFQDWRCRCTPFNDWARIVTQFFERRVIEHADQQCHERHNGSKDRNYREKIPCHGTQHRLLRGLHTTPWVQGGRPCKSFTL